MRLHLVQNQPFTPMHDAWTNNADEVERMPREEVLRRVSATYTNMLANATPPYAVSGGVREVLKAADGCTYAVSNDEARAGYERVLRHHEFAPAPEGGAALAGLVQAVARGAIPKGDTVLVHMTGGGWQRSIDVLGRQPYPVAHRLGALDVDGVSRAVASYLSRLEISEAAPREAR
jgi:cysteate synthase